jgi:alpha-1,3-rhamnosyl/mannosyltransferase
MNLLVNVTPLLENLTGVGRYTKELLARLLVDPDIADIAGFSDIRRYQQPALQALIDSCDMRMLEQSPHPCKSASESIYYAFKPLAKKIPYARIIRDGVKGHRLRRSASKYRDYVYWEPNFVLQAVEAVKVATIHDLSYLHFPDFHPPDRVRWLEAGLERAVSEAACLMTVSEFSKQELQQTFALPADKIAVVPPGISDGFLKQCSARQIADCRSRYGLPDAYILSVGTLEPRKNVKGLIEAYQRLPDTLRKRYPLVLAGCKGWLLGDMESSINRLVARGEIYQLGFVAQQDLPALYQAASIFAYVSLYEGFGMPVIEAMASSVPVITSDRASMPEAACGHAVLIDPDDNDSIVNALTEVLEVNSRDAEVLYQARLAAQQYSWATSVDKFKAAVASVG